MQSLPRIKPHYAIKANNDPLILRLFAHLDTGFDCASQAELEQVLEIGVDAERIIYANPCKAKSSLIHAYRRGVDYMTFDNEHELHKVKESHASAKLLLRIKTDDSSAKWALGIKFGADMKTALGLVDLARELKLNLVGVAFHVGCSNLKVRKIFSHKKKSKRRRNCKIMIHILNNLP